MIKKETLSMADGTTVPLKIRLQTTRPEKTGKLDFFDWTLPPVLAEKLRISNHLALGVYDPLSPKNTFLIQTVTRASFHLAMNTSERPSPLKNPNTIPLVLPNSLYCYVSFLDLPLLATCLMAVFALTRISFFLFLHGYIYIYIILCK